MKSATISIASIAGTLGVVAAIGFAQPDGLQPPTGPVDDTQPSLASISQQIASLNGDPTFPIGLRFAHVEARDSTETIISATEADFVRLQSISVGNSRCTVTVGPAQETLSAFLGGGAWNGFRPSGSFQVEYGGLRVPTPVQVTDEGDNGTSFVTAIYWVEGENQ